MNLLDGARWISGLFTGVLNWTPTASRLITFPDDSGTVQLNGKSSTVYRPIVSVTTFKVLGLLDFGTYQYCTNSSAITISIPLDSEVLFVIGSEVEIKKGGSGTLSIIVSSGVSLLGNGGTTVTTPYDLTKGATIKKVGVNVWILEGS